VIWFWWRKWGGFGHDVRWWSSARLDAPPIACLRATTNRSRGPLSASTPVARRSTVSQRRVGMFGLDRFLPLVGGATLRELLAA
jgi:hypothetical protein